MTKLTESKKAQFGIAFIATTLGMVTQGLPITTAAYLIAGITALEIIAWAIQDRGQ